MGGEVLELWPDRAKRLADEAYACGYKEGYEEGFNEVIDELSAKMIELGVDEALIEEIASSVKAAHRKA